MVSKEYAFKYYDIMVRQYEAAHNHKEVSAWGGLVLELAVCAGVLRITSDSGATTILIVSASTMLALVTFLVARYIYNQLEQKDLNSAYSAAAKLILAEIALEKDDEIDDRYIYVEKNANGQFQSDICLPKFFQYRKDLLNLWGKGRKITRQMIFSILIVMPAGTLLSLLLPKIYA